MRFRALFAIAAVFLSVSCRSAEEKPPPPPDLDRDDLTAAVLDASVLGEGWIAKDTPGPNTVQIGGRVGAASVRPVQAESTSAFDQEEGTGYVSNTVILLRSENLARTVMTAHKEAASRTEWKQDRDDGGRTTFRYNGPVQNLPALGDDAFSARLNASITDPEGETSEHKVEYIAFNAGPLVGFVVTQDVPGGRYARRLETRVARLLTER